ALWARAHIAVLPSHREGLPLSLLEAAACGRPLVATDVPGCRDIARADLNALLVPVEDPEALANAIDRLARDPQLRRKFGRAGHDRTREVEAHDLRHSTLVFTSDPGELSAADFFIVTVPTPIDQARRPDLTSLLGASATVGKALKKGDIVVYESTVYPGATEEDCVPVLEQVSGLAAGRDFTVGYSPERINPGDRAHRFETITK